MTIVHDTIDAEIAKLTETTAIPEAPFGYGADLRCSSDLTPTMDEVDGFSTLALAEAIVRRLDCPRGALPDDPTYGIDLRGMCNRGTTAAELRDLGGAIRGELEKDDRIDSVVVVVTPASDGSSLVVRLVVRPIDPNAGTFTLTLTVRPSEVLVDAIAEGGA